jgi:hypothetical protein
LEIRVPAGLTAAEGRKFAFPVGIAFWVITAVLIWRGHTTAATVTGSLGGALLVAGLLVPGKLGPVYRAWMGFALLLSKVTTPIFMGIVFFLTILPIGLLIRLFGRNPIRQVERDGSYFVPRPVGSRQGNLSRQF